jgi:hypothetical protein
MKRRCPKVMEVAAHRYCREDTENIMYNETATHRKF